MVPPKPTACPSCGSSKVTNTGKKEFYRLGSDRKKDSPYAIIYAFKCECGHSWGVEVQAETEKSVAR